MSKIYITYFREVLVCHHQQFVEQMLDNMVRGSRKYIIIKNQTFLTICNRKSFVITVYMDIGTASTATATLAFAFSTTTSTTRQWEVKVTQIKCFGRER